MPLKSRVLHSSCSSHFGSGRQAGRQTRLVISGRWVRVTMFFLSRIPDVFVCVLPCSSTAPVAVEAHPGPLFRFHHSRPCPQCHLGGLFLPMLRAHLFSLFASELHLQSFQLFQFVHVFFLSFPGVAGVLRAIFPLSGIFFPQGKRRPHQTVPASIHGGQ